MLMKFDSKAKLINYSTIITLLYDKYGVGFVDSKEFTDIISVNDPFTVLKFLFLISYEIQDSHPESIDDTYGIIPKIESSLDKVWDLLKDTTDWVTCQWWYYMAKSFLAQYNVMYTIDEFVLFLKRNKVEIESAKILTDVYIDSLVSALVNLEKAGNPCSKDKPHGDVLLIEMMEFERNQLVGLLRGILQEDKIPDISSVILFSDQLDNSIWWRDVKRLTWEYVESKLNAGA